MAYADIKKAMPTSIRLDENLRLRLQKQAKSEKRSMANLLAILIEEGLDAREKKSESVFD